MTTRTTQATPALAVLTALTATLHPLTDRLVTGYWRLRSRRACLACRARGQDPGEG